MTDCLSLKRDELTELLRSKLIECGWRDQVANWCRALIQEQGVEQIRLEQIIRDVRPKARQSVPEQVKLDLIEAMRRIQSAPPAPVEPPTELAPPEQLAEPMISAMEEEAPESSSVAASTTEQLLQTSTTKQEKTVQEEGENEPLDL